MDFRPRTAAALIVLIAVNGAALAAPGVVFNPQEIAIIHDYYAQSSGSAGHASQKKDKGKPLPPGVARNLARGKPLPPGIAKRSLPGDLDRRLPPVTAGYERLIVDGRILLVETATQVIHDILEDAILR
jgi:hypothetical protein